MGARDLYIAEVYDVSTDGATQKPYGRVFYTKGRSLVFYAYDLDQQAGAKNATFQAWGRRGPDTQQAVLRHNSKRTENSALPCRDGCPI